MDLDEQYSDECKEELALMIFLLLDVVKHYAMLFYSDDLLVFIFCIVFSICGLTAFATSGVYVYMCEYLFVN
jgi:hypothetical protein